MHGQHNLDEVSIQIQLLVPVACELTALLFAAVAGQQWWQRGMLAHPASAPNHTAHHPTSQLPFSRSPSVYPLSAVANTEADRVPAAAHAQALE